MLDAYLFDEDHGKKIEAWADALDDLDQSQVLWLDLLEPSAEEAREWERHSAWMASNLDASTKRPCNLPSTKVRST